MNDKANKQTIDNKNYFEFFKKIETPTYVWKKIQHDLILIDYNNAADKLTNYTMKNFLGIKASEHYKDNSEVLEDLIQCANNKIIQPREMTYRSQSIDLVRDLYVSYSFVPPDLVYVHTDDISKQKQAELAMKKSIDKIKILNKLIININKADNIASLFKISLNSTLELMEFDGGGIYLIDEIKKKACLVKYSNLPPDFIEHIKEVSIEKGYYRTVFFEGKPIFSDNYDKINNEYSQKWKFLSLASIPLIIEGNPIGALNIISRIKNIFSEEEKDILLVIGTELSNAFSRIKAEEDLKSKQAEIESIFKAAPIGIGMVVKRIYKRVNDYFCKLVGYSREELIDHSSRMLYSTEEEYNLVGMEIIEKIKKEGIGTVETKLKRKDNKIIDVLLSCTTIGVLSGGFTFTALDITEWKKANQKIRESEDKYHHLFDNSPYIIALLNIKGDILDVNTKIEDILGLTKDEVIGQNYLELGIYNKNSFPELRERLNQFSSREKLDPYEVLVKAKDGTNVWLLSYINPFELAGDSYILSVVLDITEEKKAEIRLKSSEQMYREAYNRAEFYKDLFAHDINNILQNIRSANELRRIFADKKDMINKIEEIDEIINSQVIRGANLVSNIRKSSLLEEFSRKIKPIHFNLLLESAITFTEKMFQEKDIRIRVHPFDDKLKIQGNEFILDVFENILINAVKYNNKSTIKISIDIDAIKQDGINYVRFQFSDNGMGIQDIRKEKIFQRSQEKLSFETGMGLGLSLVKQILKIYEGSITVEDRINGDYTKGSNFIILIPEAIDDN